MASPYFRGYQWSQLTCEERFYCFVLYSHASRDPAAFARFVVDKAKIGIHPDGPWDLGIEVCFYRDYRWHNNLPVRKSKFSPKRTFDICLFGPSDIVILEAKVDQPFRADQDRTFVRDVAKVRDLLGRPTLGVWLVALASRRHFDPRRWTGKDDAQHPFGNRKVTWDDTYDLYSDPLLDQAEKLYGSHSRLLVGAASA